LSVESRQTFVGFAAPAVLVAAVEKWEDLSKDGSSIAGYGIRAKRR
jgi:hypothetical protein